MDLDTDDDEDKAERPPGYGPGAFFKRMFWSERGDGAATEGAAAAADAEAGHGFAFLQSSKCAKVPVFPSQNLEHSRNSLIAGPTYL